MFIQVVELNAVKRFVVLERLQFVLPVSDNTEIGSHKESLEMRVLHWFQNVLYAPIESCFSLCHDYGRPDFSVVRNTSTEFIIVNVNL